MVPKKIVLVLVVQIDSTRAEPPVVFRSAFFFLNIRWRRSQNFSPFQLRYHFPVRTDFRVIHRQPRYGVAESGSVPVLTRHSQPPFPYPRHITYVGYIWLHVSTKIGNLNHRLTFPFPEVFRRARQKKPGHLNVTIKPKASVYTLLCSSSITLIMHDRLANKRNTRGSQW